MTSLDPGTLPTRLRKLIQAPRRMSAQKLWRALTDDERTGALSTYIAEREQRDHLVQLVADHRKFRRKTVSPWDDGKLIEAARRIPLATQHATLLVMLMHRERRSEMLGDFLSSIGIPHENGMIPADETKRALGEYDADPGRVPAAAAELAREHGLRRVVVYFLHILLTHGRERDPIAQALEDWLRALSRGEQAEASAEAAVESEAGEDAAAEAREDLAAESAPEVDSGWEDVPEYSAFTTLDTLLHRATIESEQDVLGSLDEDQVDDAVDEFASLNGLRPHSYFHVGFRDALFNGSPPGEAVDDPVRGRWYWAGAISGWGRREEWEKILGAYDGHEVARRLGDGRDFATEEAALPVVTALAQAGRVADAVSFATVRGLRRHLETFQHLLDVGSRALHNDEDATARIIFKRLMEAVRAWEKKGLPASEAFMDVRRRYAHCLQRAGELDRARGELERLLEIDADPGHRAMVRADLGLLAGRFNRLEDVSLPRENGDLSDVRDRLELGRSHFEAAAESGARYAAHGHYCLGVLELAECALAFDSEGGAAEEALDGAEEHLLLARNRFLERRDSYGEALAERTNLYFGVARATSPSSTGDLKHAARVMTKAVEGGAAFPPYLVSAVLEGLDLGAGPESVRDFAATLLEATDGDSEVLDGLAASDVALEACVQVADGLSARARNSGDGDAAARDLRGALRGFLANGAWEKARRALDRLESLAARDIGAREFDDLLSRRDYGRVWEPEEATIARARCHEAYGKYEDAYLLLLDLIHQYALESLDDAEGLLRRIRGYGLSPDHYEEAENRVAALRQQERAAAVAPEAETPGPARTVRVLLVGGDERQQKHEGAVRRLLAERAPHVAATFVHPGWGGNWNKPLAEVRRRLPQQHAVVLMRFMRTELGRRLRKEIGKRGGTPWRFCWSSGPQSMAEAIMEAARAAEEASAARLARNDG